MICTRHGEVPDMYYQDGAQVEDCYLCADENEDNNWMVEDSLERDKEAIKAGGFVIREKI